MSADYSTRFAALLDVPADDSSRPLDRRAVFLPLAVAALLTLLWASLAPISSRRKSGRGADW